MNRHEKAQQTVWNRGADAARAGLEESACPYPDRRTYHGAITWSRSWRRQWLAGFRSVKKAGNVPPPAKAVGKNKRGGNGKGEEKSETEDGGEATE